MDWHLRGMVVVRGGAEGGVHEGDACSRYGVTGWLGVVFIYRKSSAKQTQWIRTLTMQDRIQDKF